jgi:hypothetical protein
MMELVTGRFARRGEREGFQALGADDLGDLVTFTGRRPERKVADLQ